MATSNSDRKRHPALVAPVSRFLSVADLNLSIAFYRDVLGFEVKPEDERAAVETVELDNGPARIVLGTHVYAIDSTGQLRPRGAAMLFFQTDDVVAMREAICSRAGKPSELEKVNWIKMQMFEIRDPDGHTLWFGQSYDQPDQTRPLSMLWKALPDLPFDDVSAAVTYYRDILGFNINYAQEDIAVMYRDEVTILLIQRDEQHKGIGSCYVYVRDADALYSEFVTRGANVQGEPVSHPWGLRDFHLLDLEGNRIAFGQPFE